MDVINIEVTRNEFNRVVHEVGEQMLSFPWYDKEKYAMWLAQTYFYVRHTTHLICLAALGFGPDERADHYHALEHLSDENGHDLMAKNDYLNLMGLREIDLSLELVETSLFYQNQYFVIEKWGPTAHLGYSLLLEGIAAVYGPDLFQKINKHHAANCSQFIQVHSELDQDHYREGLKSFAKLTPAQQRAALLNLKQSAFLYSNMLKAIQSNGFQYLRKVG